MTKIITSLLPESFHEWPPQYKLKKHRRARNVKLRASKPHGLQITVPYRFNVDEIPAILEKNKTWIIKQLLLLQSRHSDVLPDQIILNAISEVWTVKYIACDAKLELIQRPAHEIVLVGRIKDKVLCKTLLIEWLKNKSNMVLISHLENLSHRMQLHYSRVTIRDQQTLWGSCTAATSISLNYKLLFLPKELVTHVMIHELCHTQYLNHSSRFWGLVAQHDPAWREMRRKLRRADQLIPLWI
jgi:predicted metal-dependent hydrolase